MILSWAEPQPPRAVESPISQPICEPPGPFSRTVSPFWTVVITQYPIVRFRGLLLGVGVPVARMNQLTVGLPLEAGNAFVPEKVVPEVPSLNVLAALPVDGTPREEGLYFGIEAPFAEHQETALCLGDFADQTSRFQPMDFVECSFVQQRQDPLEMFLRGHYTSSSVGNSYLSSP